MAAVSAGGLQQQAPMSGSSLPYQHQQELQKQLSQQQLQELQPYLDLSHVLSGLDRVLQLLLGLRLVHRQPQPGELWADHIIVLELQQPAASGSAQQVCVLGTVYVDLNAGYAAQLLLYGRACPFLTTQHRHDPQAVQPAAGDGTAVGLNAAQVSGSNTLSSSVPAVALGLQSGGVLCGTCNQVSLGLWELCHELGHAVNFILSSGSSSQHPPDVQSRAGDAGNGIHNDRLGGGAAAPSSSAHSCYHMHASWLPVDLVELPSTLFEGLAMDGSALQLLCQHKDTGEAMPLQLAHALAGCTRAAHYSPSLHQSMVRRQVGCVARGTQQLVHPVWVRCSVCPATDADITTYSSCCSLPLCCPFRRCPCNAVTGVLL